MEPKQNSQYPGYTPQWVRQSGWHGVRAWPQPVPLPSPANTSPVKCWTVWQIKEDAGTTFEAPGSQTEKQKNLRKHACNQHAEHDDPGM